MKSPRIIIRSALTIILSLGFLLTGWVMVQANPQENPGINKIYITDVRDSGFTVSWTTNLASNGSLNWGTSTPPTTLKEDTVTNTTTHRVEVTSLLPETTYYFEVKSGDATDNNSGAYYQVTTGPILTTPTNDITIYGYMYQSDGTTPVANAIVYLQLQDANGGGSPGSSQWISKRTSGTGYWSFTMGSTRTSDFQNYFSYTKGADLLRIIGQGGSAGTKGVDPNPWTITIPTDTFQQNIILNQDPTMVTMLDINATNTMPVAIPLVVAVGLVGVLAVAGLAWRKNKALQD